MQWSVSPALKSSGARTWLDLVGKQDWLIAIHTCKVSPNERIPDFPAGMNFDPRQGHSDQELSKCVALYNVGDSTVLLMASCS